MERGERRCESKARAGCREGIRAHNIPPPPRGPARSPQGALSHRLGLCHLLWNQARRGGKENVSCDPGPHLWNCKGRKQQQEKKTLLDSQSLVLFFERGKQSALPCGPRSGPASSSQCGRRERKSSSNKRFTPHS